MPSLLSAGTKTWLHGLFAAAISTFATSASGAIALPTVFTFDKNGMINMLKLSAVPAMIAVFTYLKQSPLPPASVIGPGDKATIQDPKITPEGTISGTSAVLEKASNPEAPKPPEGK
jgi:hypothetical protein